MEAEIEGAGAGGIGEVEVPVALGAKKFEGAGAAGVGKITHGFETDLAQVAGDPTDGGEFLLHGVQREDVEQAKLGDVQLEDGLVEGGRVAEDFDGEFVQIKIEPAADGATAGAAPELGWDVNSLTDTQLSTDMFYVYRIRAWNGAGNSPYSNTVMARTLNAFAQWKLDRDFPTAALDSFDGDGDGVGLFLEYALGLDPALADTVGMPVPQTMGGILAISYAGIRPELQYIVEASTIF